MRRLRTIGIGVLLAATLAIGGVASGSVPADPNNDTTSGDSPAGAELAAVAPPSRNSSTFRSRRAGSSTAGRPVGL